MEAIGICQNKNRKIESGQSFGSIMHLLFFFHFQLTFCVKSNKVSSRETERNDGKYFRNE